MRKTTSLHNPLPITRQVPTWAWLLTLVPLSLWLVCALVSTPEDLFRLTNQSAHAMPDLFWVFFDLLGNGWYVFSLASPLLLIAPRLLLSGLCAGAIAGTLGRILKLSLEMPRPASVLDPSTFYILGKQLHSLAMPSGHTLTAFALATSIYFSASHEKRKPLLLLFALATGTALARIAVGAHWPADVLAGSALGMLGGVAGAQLCTRIPEHLLQPRAWLMRVLGALLLLCIYMLLSEVIDFPESYPLQLVAAAITLSSFVLFMRRTLTLARQA